MIKRKDYLEVITLYKSLQLMTLTYSTVAWWNVPNRGLNVVVCESVFLLRPTKCVKTFHHSPGFKKIYIYIENVQSLGPLVSKEEILG